MSIEAGSLSTLACYKRAHLPPLFPFGCLPEAGAWFDISHLPNSETPVSHLIHHETSFIATMPLQFELCPGRMIGGDHPCFIIAEIGQNHQGDIEIAKKMIKMAKVNQGGKTIPGRRLLKKTKTLLCTVKTIPASSPFSCLLRTVVLIVPNSRKVNSTTNLARKL